MSTPRRIGERVNIPGHGGPPPGRGPGGAPVAAALALCAVLAAAGPAPADVIVFWSLGTPSSATGTPIGPTSTLPGVVASDLAEQAALQHFEKGVNKGGLVGLNAAPAPGTTPGAGGVSSTTAIHNAFNSNDTFSFTVTPPTGFEFDLTSLTFNIAAGGNTNGPPRGTGVRSSLTDGADLLLVNLPLPPPNTVLPETLSLTGNPAFQDITGPVTFFFAVATPNGNDTIQFNNITLNGTLAPIPPPPPVPEPSTLALLALGGGALAGWRRWQKRKAA